MPPVYDVAVIGAGIVGLASARALLLRHPKLRLVVIEAERDIAQHQTGHNSGVIHSGLYYKPGSLKAQNCTAGREDMYRFCQEHGIAHERCGKIVVATQESELPALEELKRRGTANGLKDLAILSPEQIREHEPHIQGIAGMFVAETGIVHYPHVAEVYARHIQEHGGEIHKQARFQKSRPGNGDMTLETSAGEFQARHLLNCGGLQSDRVARACGVDPGVQIIPFRGEYYEIVPERRHLVKNLVYPVPDPRFPFLGVHFTRTTHGMVEAGPNAVLAFRREGYRRTSFSFRDSLQLVGFAGFWKMAWKYGRTGMGEMYRSFSKRAFLRALQRLMPELTLADIRPAGAGVRAQAVDRSGALIDDFRIVAGEKSIHVLNAPSPAATASLAIGRTIGEQATTAFGL